jgi:hypothetical protein
MHPMTIVDPNMDIMIGMYRWNSNVRYLINACILALKDSKKKNNDKIVDQVVDELSEGIKREEMFDRIAYSDKIKVSKNAMERLMTEKGMSLDKSAYYIRYRKEVEEAVEDDKKMAEINRRWKEIRTVQIVDRFNEIVLNNEKIEDYLGQKMIPGVKVVLLGEIENNLLPFCPVAGLDEHLQLWFKQLGTSSEERVITGDAFGKISSILSKSNFPRNLKANSVESIARDLLRNNLLTVDEIQLFLLMRGADLEEAQLAAISLSTNIDMLRYLSDVSAFSFVGEGFTDKSTGRISQLVQFMDIALDNESQFSKTIKAVAYQFIRTDNLWDYVDGCTISRPRRYAKILIDDQTIITYLQKGINAAAAESISLEAMKVIEFNIRNVMFSSMFD